jgi:hypothetical protein
LRERHNGGREETVSMKRQREKFMVEGAKLMAEAEAEVATTRCEWGKDESFCFLFFFIARLFFGLLKTLN